MPVPDPITRREQFLAAAAGGSADNLPDPITREEVYLKAIADNAGDGGGGGGGGSSTLAGLTDVDLTNPTDGQTLVYDGTAGKWVNGSGDVINIPVTTDAQTGAITMQKTWSEIDSLLSAGKVCVVLLTEAGEHGPVRYQFMVQYTEDAESLYYVSLFNYQGTTFICESPNGYPVYEP